jgi:hypothetical protein
LQERPEFPALRGLLRPRASSVGRITEDDFGLPAPVCWREIFIRAASTVKPQASNVLDEMQEQTVTPHHEIDYGFGASP